MVLIVTFLAFYQMFQHRDDEGIRDIEVSELDRLVSARQIERINATLDGDVARVRTRDREGARLRAEVDLRRLGQYQEAGVVVSMHPHEDSVWLTILSQWLPVVFLFLFFIFLMRRLQARGGQLPSFQPEPSALPDPGPLRGLDEVRRRLAEAARAAVQGREGPRRVLISRPPGSGKTALLKAFAADAGLKVLYVSGSELVELMLGIGAQRVRKLFELAGKAQPVLVAIEDLDAFAKLRSTQPHEGERNQTMLELCQWLDGLKPLPARVMFLATTSRPDLLDDAMLRPGRFQLHVKLTPEGGTVEG